MEPVDHCYFAANDPGVIGQLQHKRIVLLLHALLFISGVPVHAQSLIERRVLTTVDGLADRVVTDLHRDQRGFLWVIGPRGLQRYDGNSFRSYGWIIPDSLRSALSPVQNFHFDAQGWLWLVEPAGRFALRFDPITEQTRFVQGPVVLPTIPGIRRLCAVQFPFYDVVERDLDMPAYREWLNAGLLDDEIRAVERTADGQHWIHGRHGRLFLWDPTERKAPPKPVPVERWRNSDWPLIDRDAVIWLPDTGARLRPIQLPASILDEAGLLLRIDDLGEVWLASLNNRLYRIDQRTSALLDHGILPGAVLRIHRDQEGLAWVATEAGLVCLRPGNGLFSSKGNEAREGGGIAVGNSVRGIVQLRNGEYLGFNDMGRSFRWTLDAEPAWVPIPRSSGKSHFVQGIFKANDGAVWIQADGGLHLLDTERMRVIRTLDTPGKVVSVHPSPDGRRCLIFLGNGMAAVFDPARETIGPSFVLTKALRAAVWFDGDRVLVPASTGITIYDIKAGSHRQVDLHLAAPLDESMVRSMEFLGPILFLGTGSGLIAVDLALGQLVRTIRFADGLADEVVYSLLAEKNRLWVGTRNGLSLVDPATWECFNFSVQDGLPFNEFNAGAVRVDASGHCWMGGVNGWVFFDPERVSKIPREGARLNISSARNYNERSGQWSDLGQTEWLRPEGLVLGPHARTLSISFMLAALFDPQANRYSYYLDGYEPEWFHTGSRPVADYLDLPPGRYVFRVKARDHRGGAAANELALPVTVLQVWYLRPWAILIWVLFAAAAITLLVRMEFLRRLEHAEAERIRRLDMLKDRFFANVTHEFRTPITVIQGLADQLGSTPPQEQEAIRAKATVIRRNGQRLLGLVDRILDLTRLDHTGVLLKKEPGLLLAYLRHTLPAYRSLAEIRGLGLEICISGEDLPVFYDAEHLGQVIDNLITNALKFTPRGGLVTVKAALHHDPECMLMLEVLDTGPGIAPMDLPLLFDRFFQSSTNDRAATGGTGIGLALVKELVHAMKGTVVAGNRAAGGSVFSVQLPLEQAGALRDASVQQTHEHPFTPPVETDRPPADTNAPLVLVVEDDVDVGDHIAECIGGEYRVLRAMDGTLGVAMALEEVPDLVLSDVMMPGMDGFRLCEQLKADPRTSHVPIALLTARADRPSRLQGITRGADAYLAKPFDARELRGVLANLMRLRRGIQEHYRTVWEHVLGSAGPIAPVPVPSASDPAPSGSPLDGNIEDVFLTRVRDLLERVHADPDYSVERLADDLGLSRSQAFRKIKSLTGQSPMLLLRSFRLLKARSLLEKGGMTISEVAYGCGFSSPNYFSDAFLQEYGHRPSEVAKQGMAGG
jgi:signal transduction histidine kinase/AraC-like DNA-binding protein/DNA-binding NarL/FixJ family response regulator